MEPLLKAENLSKSFGTLPVVLNVNLEVHTGEVVGVISDVMPGITDEEQIEAILASPPKKASFAEQVAAGGDEEVSGRSGMK